MRKIFNTLVASILLVACLFIVGCAKIPKDYKDARSNLLKKDYDTYVMADLEDFMDEVVWLSDWLVEDDDESLDDYEWLWDELDNYKRDFDKGIVAVNEVETEVVCIAYFKDSKSARKVYKEVKELFEEYCQEELSSDWEGNENIKYGRSGKVIYIGTEGALEDVRG